jgi:hypothetical protein
MKSFIMANMFYYASYFDQKKQEQFIKLYFKEANLSYDLDQFKKNLELNFKLIALSAVVWALKASLKAKDKKEFHYYFKLAKDRLNFPILST